MKKRTTLAAALACLLALLAVPALAQNKTTLFSRHQPGGTFTLVDEGTTTGNIWWVLSTSTTGADAAGYGQSPDSPFLSLDYAITQVTANNGDIIYLMPNHVEVATAADPVGLTTAGVKIVFQGQGATRARVSFGTAVGADLNIDAANITLVNPLFVAALDALTGPIDVNAADFTILNGEYRDGTAIDTTDCIVADANADRMLIDGWTYVPGTEAGTQKQSNIQIAGADNVILKNIHIRGSFATGAIENGTAWVKALLDNVVVENTEASPTVAMLLQAGSSGTVRNSDFRVASGTPPVCVTAANAMQFFGDRCTGTNATRGVPIGTALASDPDAQGLKIDSLSLNVAPTAGSLARYVASGGTALGTALADSKSLVDALGFNGTTVGAASAGSLAYQAGTRFTIVSAVTSSSIPNNTQVGGAITAASTGGALILQEVVAQCDAVGWATPTNIEFTTDNVRGKTGVAAPFILRAIAGFGANLTMVGSKDGATKILPIVLETGKKIYVDGDDAAGTGAGVCSVYLTFERAVDGATIAAVNLP